MKQHGLLSPQMDALVREKYDLRVGDRFSFEVAPLEIYWVAPSMKIIPYPMPKEKP